MSPQCSIGALLLVVLLFQSLPCITTEAYLAHFTAKSTEINASDVGTNINLNT